MFEYAVEVDRGSRMTIPGGAQIEHAEGWSPDHLLLAALVRCSIDSFTYHARRAGHEASRRPARRDGKITKRDAGRALRVRRRSRSRSTSQLDAARRRPDDLIAKAERDCFVGASLTITPEYTWRVS